MRIQGLFLSLIHISLDSQSTSTENSGLFIISSTIFLAFDINFQSRPVSYTHLDVYKRQAIQIGHAVWIKENCVPLTDGMECGNCARHCPTGAIQMVASDPEKTDSPKIPVVNVEKCIGCGACENLCPSRPFSAIYVTGHQMHRII